MCKSGGGEGGEEVIPAAVVGPMFLPYILNFLTIIEVELEKLAQKIVTNCMRKIMITVGNFHAIIMQPCLFCSYFGDDVCQVYGWLFAVTVPAVVFFVGFYSCTANNLMGTIVSYSNDYCHSHAYSYLPTIPRDNYDDLLSNDTIKNSLRSKQIL